MTNSAQPSTVVFVLASRAGERYSARTRVAMASLRATNPNVRIVVVCDRNTDASMREEGDPVVFQADSWIAIDTPPGDTAFQSRFIKTTLRSLIDGPYLYLDSDVVVRGSLDPIFALDCDIAGAPNHSRDIFAEQVWDQDQIMLQNMGWEIGSDVYINGGVLFWNDTTGARRLADEWHRRWTLSSGSQDSIRDQPAFNSALLATAPNLSVLDHRYNAQVFTSPRVATDAVIWHFYAADDSRIPERYNTVVDEVVRDGKVASNSIETLVANRDPWSLPDLQELIAKNIALLDQVFALQAELSSSQNSGLISTENLYVTQSELQNTMLMLQGTMADLQSTIAELLAARSDIGVMEENERALRNDLGVIKENERALRIELLAIQEAERAVQAELSTVRHEVMTGLDKLASTKSLLDQILSSKSWWLTRPLRAMDALAGRLRRAVDSQTDNKPPAL